MIVTNPTPTGATLTFTNCANSPSNFSLYMYADPVTYGYTSNIVIAIGSSNQYTTNVLWDSFIDSGNVHFSPAVGDACQLWFNTMGPYGPNTDIHAFFTIGAPPPPPPPPAPCFREGSQILCDVSGVETYRAIETLRPGMLVKTLTSGLMPIEMIGYTTLQNPGHSERIQNRLYKCSTTNYPTLSEDLYITGCHSILVDHLTEVQKEATLAQLERIFITEDKYRLMACIDERAEPHVDEASYTIWHIALENTEYYQNYGIWANGLLVETCSKRYIKELSGMTLVV